MTRTEITTVKSFVSTGRAFPNKKASVTEIPL